MTELDSLALLRGFLANAAARHLPVSSVAPQALTADYLAGFEAGMLAGNLSALAFTVSVLSGESITALIEDATSRAQVEMGFPFDLIVS